MKLIDFTFLDPITFHSLNRLRLVDPMNLRVQFYPITRMIGVLYEELSIETSCIFLH